MKRSRLGPGAAALERGSTFRPRTEGLRRNGIGVPSRTPAPAAQAWPPAREVCFFAALPGAGPCDGRLVRCHLLPRQLLKRELGVVAGVEAANDPRSWVAGCGGVTGVGGHHGALDFARSLRVPRVLVPEGTERLAAELGLGWWLDREFGVRCDPSPCP